MIYTSITELIGKTPLLELTRFKDKNEINAKIIAKLECFNPAGSAKDRVALNMIEDAEKKGIINKDTLIIEPTSGNTGVGLASVAASKGYNVVITMPENMSQERRKLIKAYGAKIILTDAKMGIQGAIDRANELSLVEENSFVAGQFVNDANPLAHKYSTGPEIWEDAKGNIDILVCTVGTGGTITGTGEYLKQKNPNIKVVAVEPEESAVLSGNEPGTHGIQGIGAGFIPEILNTDIIDEVATVSTEESIRVAKEVAILEGVLVGISSGAALKASLDIAKRPENKDKNIVAILPDTGTRYLSVIFGED